MTEITPEVRERLDAAAAYHSDRIARAARGEHTNGHVDGFDLTELWDYVLAAVAEADAAKKAPVEKPVAKAPDKASEETPKAKRPRGK